MLKTHRIRGACLAAPALLPLWAVVAEAAVTISTQPTQNMTCSAGTCTNTAADGVLNVGDLTSMLATGDVSVAADSAALDIAVAAPFGWASAHTLTLDANRSIVIDCPVIVTGTGGLALVTDRGGTGGDFSFGKRGHVKFWDLSSILAINGVKHTLVKDLDTLAADIAARPRAAYALADDYDASDHGVYNHAAVTSEFAGTFEGLGHTVSNFSVYDTNVLDTFVGLFTTLKPRAVVRDLNLANSNILSENTNFQVIGALSAYNAGTILNCSAAGGTVRSDFWVTAGGLIGENYGAIRRSYASVEVEGAQNAQVGGLIGNAHGHITDSYATGHTIAGDRAAVGGLIGYNLAKVRTSYATGSVSGGQGALVGGLMGESRADGIRENYWNITTSGTTEGVGGRNMPGVTGLTTDQLQSGLPRGFDPSVWAQKKKINSGFPYLPVAAPK